MMLPSTPGVSAAAVLLHLLLVAPLLAAAVYPLGLEQSSEAESKLAHPSIPSRKDQNGEERQFTIELPNGDESHFISIDGLPLPATAYSCQKDDLANVTVNGQSLTESITPPGAAHKDIYGSLHGVVNVVSERDSDIHTVKLLIAASCTSPDDDRADVSAPPHGSRAFHISIAEIDNTRWTGTGYSLLRRTEDGPEVSFVVGQPHGNSVDWHGSEIAPAAPAVPTLDGAEAVSLATDAIEQEIYRLRELQQQLKSVQQSVDEQTALVDNLSKGKLYDAKKEIKDCDSLSCFVSAIYRHSKECVHLAFLRYKPDNFGSSTFGDCAEMHSGYGSSQSKGPTSEKKSCSPSQRMSQKEYKLDFDGLKPLLQKESDDEEDEITSESQTSFYHSFGTENFSTTHKVHTILAAAASLLCLTCLATLLHRRCCNPRARAERAARREERRNRRQFRCAARKRAWKEWWETRFTRRQKRMCDYEEKRALIMHQEAILEHAMQNEISRLEAQGPRTVVNEVLAMAEEGRVQHPRHSADSRPVDSGSYEETLPAYRSRASSGRPPSYNEFDENAASFVADGFSNYTPSSTMNDDARSVRSFDTDASPASSVLELSPRQSSETLRTERSAM